MSLDFKVTDDPPQLHTVKLQPKVQSCDVTSQQEETIAMDFPGRVTHGDNWSMPSNDASHPGKRETTLLTHATVARPPQNARSVPFSSGQNPVTAPSALSVSVLSSQGSSVAPNLLYLVVKAGTLLKPLSSLSSLRRVSQSAPLPSLF